jgi:hypothetical protein
MSWYDNFWGKSKKKETSKKSASSFWYDAYDYEYDYLDEHYSDMGFGSSSKSFSAYKETHNLYKLASVRRAISNFVQIVTGKNVPVTFATKSESYTDGEKVILSADVEDNFDVSVGLALHEGSHIVLSNFQLLHQMSKVKDWYLREIKSIKFDDERNGLVTTEAAIDTRVNSYIIRNVGTIPTDRLCDLLLSTGRIGKYRRPDETIIDTLMGLTNWIEDRRIDNFIYKSAPGYRNYYQSMYDHYFNDKTVTKGIASDEFTDEDIDSYMFRIINLLNAETKLDKLSGLRAIYRILDLKNISRLKSSMESFDVAIAIMEEIMKQTGGAYTQPQTGVGKGKSDGSGDPSDINEDSDETESGDNEDNSMGGADGTNVQSKGETSNDDSAGAAQKGGNANKLSKTALETLKKKIQKQKDFLNGKLKKKRVSQNDLAKLEDISESQTELVRVGADGTFGSKGVDCIVVKKLTQSMIESDDFPFTQKDWSTKLIQEQYAEEVIRGTVLGTLLGKKLQIRSESRETIFSRLKKGKIDKRMVAALGYDNDSVFYTNEIDQYKKGNLHISMDYSGSMSGSKIRKTITSVVAIVKACEMARNLNVQVSIRSTDNGRQSLPYVVMVHDSRRDSFRQFCKYMKVLDCTNTTPEGLCFEAILKQLIPANNDVDSYFLNFSDGQPAYSINSKTDHISYHGTAAAEHTNKQVKKMRDCGINVLSYFITERSEEGFQFSNDWEIFKKSYDKAAKYVNVENVFQVAKTMNELFLQKSNKD